MGVKAAQLTEVARLALGGWNLGHGSGPQIQSRQDQAHALLLLLLPQLRLRLRLQTYLGLIIVVMVEVALRGCFHVVCCVLCAVSNAVQ